MENLQWKEIPGYESIYFISNYGHVKRFDGKILKHYDNKGYNRHVLSKNGKTKKWSTHRLVCIAFNENINNYKIVNHIDGDKKNNYYQNLEWCTTSENEKHSHKYLNKIPAEAKLTFDNETGIFYDSITKAAYSVNMKPSTLLARLRLNKNKYKRFINV